MVQAVVQPGIREPGREAAGDEPEINMTGLRATLRAAGIESILGQLMATFSKDAPRRMAAIESAAQAGDGTALVRAAHAYKGSASAVAALRLAGELGRLESVGHGRGQDVTPLVERIRARHERTLALLAATFSSQGATQWS